MTYPHPMPEITPMSDEPLRALPNTRRKLEELIPEDTQTIASCDHIAAAHTAPAGVHACLQHGWQVALCGPCLREHLEDLTHDNTCTECGHRPGLHQLKANTNTITLDGLPTSVTVYIRLCVLCWANTTTHPPT